jgi:hypothetical protein
MNRAFSVSRQRALELMACISLGALHKSQLPRLIPKNWAIV